MGKFTEAAMDEVSVVESPSRDRSDRFATDQLLREYGFRIHSRPKSGAPLWKWGRDVYSQEEALANCDEADLEYAEDREDLYSDDLNGGNW